MKPEVLSNIRLKNDYLTLYISHQFPNFKVTKMAKLFKLIFLFLTIFLNHIHGSASTTKEIDGKYFSFHTDKKEQHEASTECKNEGGILYEPVQSSTYDKVMKEAEFNNVNSVWLGIIHDNAQEGNYVYQSDKSKLLLDDYWVFKNHYFAFNKDCVVGNRIYNYKLYSEACGIHENYVCEYNGQGKLNKFKYILFYIKYESCEL